MENLRYAPESHRALADRPGLPWRHPDDRPLGHRDTAEWSPDRSSPKRPGGTRSCSPVAARVWTSGCTCCTSCATWPVRSSPSRGTTRIFEPTRWLTPTGERVACDVDDAFFATVTFASGAVGQLTFTWAGHGSPTGLPTRPVIYGTRGCLKGDTLILDDDLLEAFSRRSFSRRPGRCGRRAKPILPERPEGFLCAGVCRFSGRDRRPTRFEVSAAHEGLCDLSAAFAICESATLGRPVSVDDVLDGPRGRVPGRDRPPLRPGLTACDVSRAAPRTESRVGRGRDSACTRPGVSRRTRI